ncbi:hypothetical protein [Actinomycetospora lemnae]|uniref:Uncharacterized protein n=1 Tax=Actinomycetospora lemnae TaxID=3019891 RepID=A0ABT5SWM0_9PSEU|nr:hypothetical protein [Actinomycetospora sp. DW7H6]MDD7966860.1 hypothetical protein [Actinomycetospora sp. DW7H6]
MSDPGTATGTTDTTGPDTYTSGDGTTYGADGGLLSFPAGTPSMTSWDGDRDGYYESTATDADGDGYAETASADEDGDGYDEYAVSDHDRDGAVDEVVLDIDADGYGDAAVTDGAAYGEDGPVAVADTDGDTYADIVIPAS